MAVQSWVRALVEALVEGVARAFGRRRAAVPPPVEREESPNSGPGTIGQEATPGTEADPTGPHKGPIHRKMMGGRH